LKKTKKKIKQRKRQTKGRKRKVGEAKRQAPQNSTTKPGEAATKQGARKGPSRPIMERKGGGQKEITKDNRRFVKKKKGDNRIHPTVRGVKAELKYREQGQKRDGLEQ